MDRVIVHRCTESSDVFLHATCAEALLPMRMTRFDMKSCMEAIATDNPKLLEPQLYNPKLSKQENQSTGRWIDETTELAIGESASKQRGLYYICIQNSASRCLKLILNEPYSWNPNPSDGSDNLDPITFAYQYASARLLVELSRVVSSEPVKQDCGLRAIACMIWPELVARHTLDPATFYGFTYIMTSRSTVRKLQRYNETSLSREPGFVCSSHPPLVALFIELVFSQLPLPFDFWSGDATPPRTEWRSSWPIPHWNTVHYSRHSVDCSEFPNCLDRLCLGPLQSTSLSDNGYAWQIFIQIWAFHTLTEKCSPQVNTGHESVVHRPPSLRRLARWAVRLAITQANFVSDSRITQQCTSRTSIISEKNYVQLVQTLPLPMEMQNYLLFTDLWDFRMGVNLHSLT